MVRAAPQPVCRSARRTGRAEGCVPRTRRFVARGPPVLWPRGLPKLTRRPLLAGCSPPPTPPRAPGTNPKAAARAPPSTTTTAAPPKPRVTGAGLPADLLAVMTALYVGGKVPSAGAVAQALGQAQAGRQGRHGGRVDGPWKGTAIAVVTQGKDVTLLTKGKGWTVVGGWWPRWGGPCAVRGDARAGDRLGRPHSPAGREVPRPTPCTSSGWTPRESAGSSASPVTRGCPCPAAATQRSTRRWPSAGSRGQVGDGRAGRPASRSTGTSSPGSRASAAWSGALGGIPYVADTALKSDDGLQIVKKGLNILNASTRLAFARERKHLPNGDFGRSANQGELIKAGMVMAAQGRPGARWPKYLGKHGRRTWRTDLSAGPGARPVAELFLSQPQPASPTRWPRARSAPASGQSVVVLGGAAMSTFRDI